MNPALAAVAKHRESVQDITKMLYGDGAWEISKALDAATEKKNRRQAQVGLASNALGLAAGGAGLYASTKLPGLRKAPDLAHAGPLSGKLISMGKKPFDTLSRQQKAVRVGAAGAVGLQAANIAGDAVANRVLSRSAKKKPSRIHKSEGIPTSKGQLVQITTNAGFKAVKGAPAQVHNAKRAAKRAHKLVVVEKIEKKFDVTWTGEISKIDEDKRQVFGWASVVKKDGKEVVDLQGDYLTVDEIENAAYEYVLTSRKGGVDHERDGDQAKHVSNMIESFLVTDEKKKQMGLPEDIPNGWWVGFKVDDDEVWADAKSGKKRMFSIHGSGVRKELEIDD